MIGLSNHKQFLEQCFGHWQNDNKFFFAGFWVQFWICDCTENRKKGLKGNKNLEFPDLKPSLSLPLSLFFFFFLNNRDYFISYLLAVSIRLPFLETSVKCSVSSIWFHQGPLPSVFMSSGAQLATAVWSPESGKRQRYDIDLRLNSSFPSFLSFFSLLLQSVCQTDNPHMNLCNRTEKNCLSKWVILKLMSSLMKL